MVVLFEFGVYDQFSKFDRTHEQTTIDLPPASECGRGGAGDDGGRRAGSDVGNRFVNPTPIRQSFFKSFVLYYECVVTAAKKRKNIRKISIIWIIGSDDIGIVYLRLRLGKTLAVHKTVRNDIKIVNLTKRCRNRLGLHYGQICPIGVKDNGNKTVIIIYTRNKQAPQT